MAAMQLALGPVAVLVSDMEDTACRPSEGRKQAQASTSRCHDRMRQMGGLGPDVHPSALRVR